ncbi:Sin-like protein conserved region-domain-containing protein [Blastocladiella britannica]|nr:Sin-like protein conserved region-domain-containing protein [Blastocladiella britannica]
MDMDTPVTDEMFMNDPNDPDPIVQSLPVYLSTQLASNLHLFQFPLRSHPLPHGARINARFKPKCRAMELDIPLDTGAATFDPEKGNKFGNVAQNAAQSIYDQRSAVPTAAPGVLDHITLASTLVPPLTKYYIAAFRDDSVHLTELHATLQFTPDLKHLDELHMHEREARKKVEDEERRARGEVVDKKAAPVGPRYESADMVATRMKMVAFQKKEQDREPFVPMRYYDDTSEQAESVFEQIFAGSQYPLATADDPAAYLAQLVPAAAPSAESMGASTKAGSRPGVGGAQQGSAMRKPGSVSREDMKQLPLLEQVRTLMAHAQILPLPVILRSLPAVSTGSATEPEVVAVLCQVALPLRGGSVWVVCTPPAPIPTRRREHLARDYLVSLFATRDTVYRREFAEAAKIDPESTKEWLEQLATLVRDNEGQKQPYWCLKYTDGSWKGEETHPVYEEWAKTKLQLALKGLGLLASAAAAAIAPAARGSAARPGLVSAAPTAAGSGGAPAVDPVMTAILRLFITEGVLRADDLVTRVRGEHTATTPAEIRTKLAAVTRPIRGGLVLKARPNGTKYEHFRQVVLDLYDRSPAVKKNDLILAVKAKTGQDFPVKAFKEITEELTVQQVAKGPFVFKTEV